MIGTTIKVKTVSWKNSEKNVWVQKKLQILTHFISLRRFYRSDKKWDRVSSVRKWTLQKKFGGLNCNQHQKNETTLMNLNSERERERERERDMWVTRR